METRISKEEHAFLFAIATPASEHSDIVFPLSNSFFFPFGRYVEALAVLLNSAVGFEPIQ
jgi:hypothetical protein